MHAYIRTTVIFRIYVIFLSGAARTRKEWDVFVVLSGLNPDFY